MKHDKSGFWKAICAAPDDDTPRLVFADYLDEQQDATRAEFIRAQCESERLEPGDPRQIELEIRAAALLQEHRAVWVEELPKWVRRDRVCFRRGFPNGIETNANQLLRNASALAHRTVIEDVYVEHFGQTAADELAASPLPPRLRQFRNNGGGLAVLRPLLAAMTGLAGLNLYYPCQYDGDTRTTHFAELLALPSVRRLTRFTLYLGENDPSAVRRAMLAALAAAPFENLRELTVHPESLPSVSLAALVRAPWAGGLRALRLWHDLSPECLEVLAGAQSLAGLRALGLGIGHQGEEAFAAVLNSPHVGNVVELSVNGAALAGVAEVLGSSPLAGRLRVLTWNPGRFRGVVTADVKEELNTLTRSGAFPDLVRLSLGWWGDADAAARLLAASPHFPNLRDLELPAGMTAARFGTLLASQHLSALQAVRAPWGTADAVRDLNARYGHRFAVLAVE